MSVQVVAVIAVMVQATYGQWGSNEQRGSQAGFSPPMGGGMAFPGMASSVGRMNGQMEGMNGGMASSMGGMNGGMASPMGGMNGQMTSMGGRMGPSGMGQGFGPDMRGAIGVGIGMPTSDQMNPGLGGMNPGLGGMNPGLGSMNPGLGGMNPGLGSLSGSETWSSGGVNSGSQSSGGWGSSSGGSIASTDGWNTAVGASLGVDMSAMSALAGVGAALPMGAAVSAGVPIGTALGVGMPMGAAMGVGMPIGSAMGARFPMGAGMSMKHNSGGWGDSKDKMETTITCTFADTDFTGAVTFRNKKNHWGWGMRTGGVTGTLDVTSKIAQDETFIAVITTRSRVESGCSADGLGSIISRPMRRSWLWGKWGQEKSHKGLGTIDVDAGQSRSGIKLVNLPFSDLEDFAGRGFALCTGTESEWNGDKICQEPIAACCKLGFDNQDGVHPH